MMNIFLAIALMIGQPQLPRAEPEIHLIPDGYVGWVTIAFRAANGEPAVYEGRSRLYRIPQSGILITVVEPNVGSSPDWKFFLERADHTRAPIRLIRISTVQDTAENREDPTVGIFYIRRGRQQSGRVACDVEFDQYFVGTQAQLLSRDGPDPHRAVSDFLATHYRCR
jgi:hypothetical protein